MILEIVSALIIGNLIKSKKMALIVGAVWGFIVGVFLIPIFMEARGTSVGMTFVLIVALVEAVVIGLASMLVAGAKIKKRAKMLETKTFD